MHEVSIALSILDIVLAKCAEVEGRKIDVVRVRIGEAAGVMPDALSFAFDVAKTDTMAGEAQLVIETVPLGGMCTACGRGFTLQEARYNFACPLCSSESIEINRGREMEIVDMEIDS